ncbi:MAG: hypothetical protein EXS31_04915 [Pedosphaera sp.]|nr:hypothetical protein [Pedosphaera sp.]
MVMTGSADDGPDWQPHIRSKDKRRTLANRGSLTENSVGVLFSGKRLDGEARRGRIPAAVSNRGATKPDGLLRENPPGVGSFARVRRWLGRHSPLRGCSFLAALATAKILIRRTPRNFQSGSEDAKDPFRIVIVREGEAPRRLWLTGFDAPCLHTMYADKPMQGHGRGMSNGEFGMTN